MKTTYPQNCNQCGRESIVGDIANHWICPYCYHVNSPYENQPGGGCLIAMFVFFLVLVLFLMKCTGAI